MVSCKHKECELVETFDSKPNNVRCRKCHEKISETETKGIIYAVGAYGKDCVWRTKQENSNT